MAVRRKQYGFHAASSVDQVEIEKHTHTKQLGYKKETIKQNFLVCKCPEKASGILESDFVGLYDFLISEFWSE